MCRYKDKYTSHTTAQLMFFTRAFCHIHVKNFLKGPKDNLAVDNI